VPGRPPTEVPVCVPAFVCSSPLECCSPPIIWTKPLPPCLLLCPLQLVRLTHVQLKTQTARSQPAEGYCLSSTALAVVLKVSFTFSCVDWSPPHSLVPSCRLRHRRHLMCCLPIPADTGQYQYRHFLADIGLLISWVPIWGCVLYIGLQIFTLW